MKNICTSILLILLFLSFGTYAQLNYNSFLSENIPGTYVDLGTNGTIIPTLNKDNANSNAQNIGFTFRYNSQSFTQFRLNTNGFIKLGSSSPSSAALFYTTANTTTGGVFNSTSTADVNFLVPFNHDLTGNGAVTEYRMHTSGTAGSRVCTIQFKNVKDKTTIPYNQFDSINFQIKLYESSNIIEFIYGNWYASSDSSRFKSSACGLKGAVGATTNQLVVVSKSSGAIYSDAAFLNGNYTGNAFNFGNSNPGDGTGPNGSRPMVDPGRTFRFTPAFLVDINIDLVIAQGELAIPWGLPHNYRARISNIGINAISNYYVYMDITGANTFKDSAFISSLNPGISTNINFGNYAPENLGLNDIHVYVKSDSNNSNNSVHYRQEISHDKFSHVDTTKAPAGIVGYNAGQGGMILHKYHITGKRRIVQTGLFISDEPSNIGNNIYGVVLDGTGTLLAKSANFVITPNDLGTWKNVDITLHPTTSQRMKPPLITNSDYYCGIAVTAGSVRYTPVGHAIEDPLRANTFFYLGNFTGGTPTVYPVTLQFRSYLRAVARGNSLKLESDISLKNPSCPSSSDTVMITVKNRDSIAVDFSIDTLKLSVSSTGPVTQSFSASISSGILEPDSSASFAITNNFDISLRGSYAIKVSAITNLEVDTADNYKSININVVDTPDVSLVVKPFNVLCYGIPFSFEAFPFTAGSKSYQWKINGVNSGGVTTDSTFSPALVYGDKVNVDLITDHCTTGTFIIPSNEIEMLINPIPKLINNGADTDTVIENTSKNYAVGITAGSSYKWTVIGGTVNDSTGNAVTVNWEGPNLFAKINCTETDLGNCSYTNSRDVVIISIIGIRNENSRIGIGYAYPNPANNTVTIPLISSGNWDINLSLYDISGKQVKIIYNGKVTGDRAFTFAVDDLKNGLYFYKIKTSDGFESVKKLTVQH